MSLSPEVLTLLQDEEDRLKKVIQSLLSQQELARRRLRIESERAQDFTAQLVAARRDTEKQMLASDEAVSHGLRDRKREELDEIERLLERPYFARMVLLEDENGREREIEFLLGTVSNSDCRIIDWRKAPISKLYYEYQEGEIYDEDILARERRGKIALRHKLDIEDGELRGVTCRFGSFIRTPEGWQESKGRIRGGRSRKVGELPDVLSLITAEQFRAITQDADSAVVIQGIAGSGKTTVALHRLSWLLTPGNSDIQKQDTLILVRSKPLRAYIEQSLPSLDLSGVPCLTFAVWVKKTCERIGAFKERGISFSDEELPPSIERTLRSNALFRAIESYVSVQNERLARHLEKTLKDVPWLQSRIESALAEKTPSMRLVRSLLNALSGQVSQSWYAATHAELSSCERRLTLYREDLIRVLESERNVLERDDSRLLDSRALRETKAFLEEEKKKGKIGLSESTLLLLLATLKGDEIQRPNGDAAKYSHIVLDEVQDFSAPELALLVERVTQLSGLTLTGDAAQAISSTSAFPGWDSVKKYRNLGESSHFVELTVSHRSTAAIMRLADHVLGQARSKGGRPGKPPLWFSCQDENGATKEALGWLLRVSEKYPDAVVAVICQNPSVARYVASLLEPTFGPALRLWDDTIQEFQEGIMVMGVKDSKGLEFEHVLIWDPSEKAYPATELGRNSLYVAITRAEEHLCLVSSHRPSTLLPAHSGPLVRGIVQEPEEEDDGEPMLLDRLPSDG